MTDTNTPAPTLRLHENDDVAVARVDLAPGTPVAGSNATAIEPIPAGHKVALREVAQGAALRKYDQIIGFASAPIPSGAHVHSHNLAMADFERDYRIGEEARAVDRLPEAECATFQGYVRVGGLIATRNYLGVLTSVNCSATVARRIADHFSAAALSKYPNVDGVVALTHGTGCGMNVAGEGMVLLQRTLAGFARHPNFAGVLLIGLGCEVAQLPRIAEAEELAEGASLRMMTIQGSGGAAATVRKGIEIIESMLPAANEVTREPCPASALILGMECGGSDGYSGISANPALGAAADRLVRNGGTAILGETPEIYGAEHLLTARAATPEVAQKLIGFIKWWEDYTARNHGDMDNNPTPGNKEGGLTTILEKSLGAAAKGGTTPLMDVCAYAETVHAKGFVFMDTPGFDPASITGMVAGGANVVCFTTGRGSVYGCKPSPSIKIATNTPMYLLLSEDMDVNAGIIVDGEASIDEMGEIIFRKILSVASGEPTKSEAFGLGDEEFVPWQVGAVM